MGRLGRSHANCIAGTYDIQLITRFSLLAAVLTARFFRATAHQHTSTHPLLNVFPLPSCQINTNPITVCATVYWQWWMVVVVDMDGMDGVVGACVSGD